MSTILHFLEFLSLGTWVGSILFLSFVVAPSAFATLGSRELAGAMVGMALARLHMLGLMAGFLYLLSRVALAKSLSVLASRPALLVVAMLAPTLVSQHTVSPRMAQLRIEMGSVDAAPRDHPARAEFRRLHRVSVQLEVAVLLAGLAVLYLTARELPL